MTAYALKLAAVDDIPAAAVEIIDLMRKKGLKKAAFFGEMGAGKTTFIKGLLAALGVEEHTSSPTFSIVNEYRSAKSGAIYHFDFYRLKTPSEAMDIGIEEIFEQDAWIFMEWPEKIGNLLPADCVMVRVTEEKGYRLIEAL